MAEVLRQLSLQLNIFLPALLAPLSIAIVVLMLRKQFHDLWTPAVDVFAVLLASELVLLYEHDRLRPPAIGVDLIHGLMVLLTITFPLLIWSLVVEFKVIDAYIKIKKKAERQVTVLLWASAVTVLAGQLALLLGPPMQTVVLTQNPGK